jgi:hypothetical protein
LILVGKQMRGESGARVTFAATRLAICWAATPAPARSQLSLGPPYASPAYGAAVLVFYLDEFRHLRAGRPGEHNADLASSGRCCNLFHAGSSLSARSRFTSSNKSGSFTSWSASLRASSRVIRLHPWRCHDAATQPGPSAVSQLRLWCKALQPPALRRAYKSQGQIAPVKAAPRLAPLNQSAPPSWPRPRRPWGGYLRHR